MNTTSLLPIHHAVLRQLGGGSDARENARSAAEHGADSGFSGFTYYADTLKFFRHHRSAILALLTEMADNCGTTPSALLAGFRCLRDAGIADPMAVIANPRHEDYDTVANALAWFALEATGHALDA